MSYKDNSLRAKVSLSEKTEEWKKNWVDEIIARSSDGPFVTGQSRKDRMKIAYELYNSNFDEKDFKHVIDPFNIGDSFPSKMQNHNIIRPKIDLLLGEESKRPFTFKAVQTNDEAVSNMQTEYKQMILQYLVDTLNSEVEDDDYLSDLQRYMKLNYKNIAEDTAYNVLNYLKEKLNFVNEFLKGFKDALIAGEELYYIGILNGEPIIERANPLYCDYDRSPDIEFIDQSSWFKRKMLISVSDLYNRYYSKLDEETFDKILSLSSGGKTFTKVGRGATGGIKWVDSLSSSSLNGEDIADCIELYHTVWTAYKKVGFITKINESGNEETIIVDEYYEPGEEDTIYWEWVPEKWEGYRAGSDIHFGMQPLEFQHQSQDSLFNNKTCYTGGVYSDTNSNGKSLIDIMKPLQYMYLVLWYRLDIALSRDKGKVLLMDITQIPKSMGVTTERFLHYVSSTGVVFVNPYEEGWDIPGREGGKPASFNQFSSIDLSMSNIIAGYIELMAKIEDMIGEISGVSRQRQGQVQRDELVNNVRQTIVQSSHITEPLFWKHNQIKRRCLNMLIDTAKAAWSSNSKRTLNFVLPDMSRVFCELNQDFIFADFDVFVIDSTKENNDIEMLKTLLQPAMQNGATLAEAAEVITGDNVLMIKRKLAEIDDRRQQQLDEQAKMEQETQRQIQQMAMDAKAEENRIKEEDSIRKAETAINVALISAETGDNEDVDSNGFKDQIDLMKLDLDKKKQDIDAKIANRKLEEDIRKNRVAERQKEKEIAIKRKSVNKPVNKQK